VPSERIQLSREKLAVAIGDRWSPAEIDAAIALLDSSGRFPSGTRKLPPDLIGAVQRERLIAAMLRAASELGYRDTNVREVIKRAGVSRPTFYEHFDNKEACFIAALDAAAARLRDRAGAAADEGGDNLRDRLRFGLEALLDFTATEADAARTLIVEARAAGAEAVVRREALLDHFADCVGSQVRRLWPDAPACSPVTAAAAVGGVESLLYSRLNKGEVDDLDSLLPTMLYFLVLPFEGHEAADEELAVPMLPG
jgi:AcrR family transcriptional regulator